VASLSGPSGAGSVPVTGTPAVGPELVGSPGVVGVPAAPAAEPSVSRPPLQSRGKG
jgi:hypothetical protein